MKKQLLDIATVLLEPEDNYIKLVSAIKQYFNLLQSNTGLDLEEHEHRQQIMLPSGLAIAPAWAANCLNDNLRTKRFFAGLYQAVLAARDRFPGTPIHILYAGTGPFATLALPLTALFSADEIRFTMLEINPVSLEMLQMVIRGFDIADYIYQTVETDACTFQVDPEQPVHILLSETMQAALLKEPQVAITLHLAPQLEPGGFIIPQQVTVRTALVNMAKVYEKSLEGSTLKESDTVAPLDPIFVLDAGLRMPEDGNHFPPVVVSIPSDLQEQYPVLMYLTEIQVFGDIVLRPRQSSLSIPLRVFSLKDTPAQIQNVRFTYRLQPQPGFDVALV